MTNNEQANIKVTLNSESAQRELERLQGEIKRLIALKEKAEKAGDVEGWKKVDKALQKATRESNKLVREYRDIDQILKNLSGASIEELRQAQRALTAQTNKLNRNTDEYVKKKAQLKLVRNELKKVNAEYRQQQSFISRASGAFNKYFGMITAGLASIAGLSMTIRSAIKDFTQFDDKLADVMKTTGLNKDQVKDLNAELEKIDTRTSQEQLLNLARVAGKLGITGEEEILGFVRAADQISVALGEDLGGAEDAVRELGKLTDIFNLKELYGQEQALLKIGSSINELGMASTANEAYLVEFSKRTAGIAPQAGVSVQNILGIAATLDALGQKAEMSSTAYSKLMTTMTKKTDEFANIAGMGIREFSQLMEEDANEAMIRVFEGINKNEGGFQQLVSTLGDLGIEGQRMTSVFGALANNTDMLREQQNLSNKAFEEGISLTNEFDIKNNTAQANLEKAIKNFAQMRRELGEKLTPAYTSVISKSKLLLQIISALVDIVSKYGRVIIISTGAIVGYTIAVKLAARWDNIHYGFLVAQNAAKKTAALLTGVLTGKIKLATIAQKAWNLVQKANPIGLLAGLISGAIVALIGYVRKARNAADEQKKLNDELERTEDILGKKQYEEFLKDIGIYTDKLITMADGSQKVIKSFNENINILDKFGEKVKSLRQNELENFKQFFEEEIVNIQRNLENIDPDSLQFDTDSSKISEYKDALAIVNKELEKISKARKKLNNEDEDKIISQEKEKALQLAAFLEANRETQIAAIQKYFHEVGEGAFDAFITAIEKEAQARDISVALKFQKEEEENEDPILDYAMQKYRETSEFQLTLAKSLLDQKLIGEQEYQDRVTEITRKAEENRYTIKRENIQRAQDLAFMSSNLVASLMDLELEQAGDNEEKKKQIKKKYADMYFAVTAAEIVADTAGAIMEGFRQLGPVAGTVAAVLLGATGAIQLGIANAQRQKTKGFAQGGYTGTGNKYEPAGIVHKKEYVIPEEGTENPALRPVIDIMEIARRNGSLRKLDLTPIMRTYPVRQYINGGYAGGQPSMTSQNAIQQPISQPVLDVNKFDKAVDKLMQWEPELVITDIKRRLARLERIDQQSKL